jgi:hypothetical protein
MRLFLPVLLIAAFAVPTTAHAGTLGLEGAQLVYRADPGDRDRLVLTEQLDGSLAANPLGDDLRLGPGCAEQDLGVECPAAGVAGLTIITGDGADDVTVIAKLLPVAIDLGEGEDTFDVSGGTVTLTGGPGDDTGAIAASTATVTGGDGADGFEIEGFDDSTGPYAVDGGAGDDRISLRHRGPGMTLSGGDGDDALFTAADGADPVAFTCGPGADHWLAAPRDTPGDGCAAHLAPITTRTVSLAFREGALSSPGSGSVTVKRRAGRSGIERERIARGVFERVKAGPLRLRLKRTSAGRRWLRRKPHLPVFVTILTRTGADHGEVSFRSTVD